MAELENSCCTPAARAAGFDPTEIRETHRVYEHAAAAIVRTRKPSDS